MSPALRYALLQPSLIRRYAFLSALILSVLVVVSALWNLNNLKDQAINLATAEAISNWKKDLSFRQWATRHGGLYVKPNERTPPNPYLSHVEDRDVVTRNGTDLTLMNPAYMMRQMTEEYEENYGIKGSITGQVLLNPINKADPWEMKSLKLFDQGVEEIIEQAVIDDKPYLRLMRPMVMQEGCVRCHGHLGFKVGDIRGGISVSIPLVPYFDAAESTENTMLTTHGGVWLAGMLVIGFISVRGRQQEIKFLAAEEKYRTLVEATTAVVWTTDPRGGFATRQQSWEDYTGQTWPEHQGYGWAEMIHPDDVERIKKIWKQALIDLSNFRGEGRIWCADSESYQYFLVCAAPVLDDKGSAIEWIGTISDTTAQKEAENALQLAHDQLETRVEERTKELRKLSLAVEQSPDMVFITDTSGTIQYVNPKFFEMTGYSASEVIGATPKILSSGDTPQDLYADLWQTITAGNEWRGDIKDKRKDGSTYWASMLVAPVKDENGEVTDYVAMHEDITERREAEQKVKKAMEKAEYADRAKSELLANMSHELRTPLNAIIGFSDTLITETFGPLANDKQKEYLNDIHFSGEHLLALINDVLDVSAIEAGKTELNESELELMSTFDDCLKLVSSRAQQGGIKLKCDRKDGFPRLFADERRTKQIVINLLTNAIKFTPQGGEVTLNALQNDDKSLTVTVADTGIGMDPAGIKMAMTEFGQVDSSLARKYEGTGLGLPLTRMLIELHGGEMKIESEPGHGTTVFVNFPVERMISAK
jgi:PAS domain S-box-containing protein